MLRRAALVALLLVLLAAPGAAALSIPPPPDRRVNDYAGALSPAERDGLEQQLIAREATSQNQVVVAVFRSLGGESLEDYSIRLAKAWRIGQKGLDNGVIFLVFLDDRKMRIEVGLRARGQPHRRGLVLHPAGRSWPRASGRAASPTGIGAGLASIDRAIAGTYQRPPGPNRGQPTHGFGWREVLALLFVAFLLMALVLNRTQQAALRRRGWTGASTGWGGPFLGGGFGGGGSGGFGGGSSSGGGFSGGGGSFGGGGSSGSW